ILTELIGETQIVKLNRIVPEDDADVYVTLESYNPTKSVKDRAAYNMIEMAIKTGHLKSGVTINETTSGDNGIGIVINAAAEGYNPTNSVKDRAAFNMIEMAEKTGHLKSGAMIIEPTSGNTGIGLAMNAAAKGYKAIMVMPDNSTEERRILLRAYGAKVVLTPS